MRITDRGKNMPCPVRKKIMTRCSIQEANRCISRPDTLPDTAQTHLGPKGITLFFTTPGRVPLINHDWTIVLIPGLHCPHYRESKIMWKQTLIGILIALWFLCPANGCLGKELLFEAEPANC